MARRKRRRTRRAAARRSRPRRRYRRNPPRLFGAGGKGIIGGVTNALAGGAGVTAGKVVARQGIALTRQDPNSPVGIAAQLAIAVAAGIAAKRFGLRGAFGDGLVYGAANGAFESLLKLVAPGQAERLLGEYGYDNVVLSAYPTSIPAAFPAGADATMGAYAPGLMM